MAIPNNYRKALTEVYEILLHLPKNLCAKLPPKLIEFIEKNRDTEYNVNVKLPLDIQDYSKEAIVLIGMLYTDYMSK